MIEPAEKLKQQLSQSIAARKQLEKNYELHYSKLTQFINRLSNVCKGIDVELDNRLGKLRKALKDKPALEKIEPILDEITQLLKQQESRAEQNIRATQNTIESAGKLLQKQKGLPSGLRRELRALMHHVAEPTNSTIHSLVPLLDQLAQLYQRAFDSKSDAGTSKEEQDEITSATVKIQEEISRELLNLVSELAFEGDHAKKIDQLRVQLFHCQTEEQLIDICISIIKLIVSSISEERVSAQFFLVSLNDALANVHQAIMSSLNTSKHINKEMATLNIQIQNQIKDLSTQTGNAKTLEELQSLVSSNLKTITDSILRKEKLEREEKMTLLDSLTVMENRLSEVEQSANKYKKHLSEQKFKSLQDSLTRLPNRAAFDERIDIEYKRWKRYQHHLCMAVIDIDHFKKINDTYGHTAGDRTLKVIAQALKKTLRATDFVARYGGEEFVVLIPEVKLEQIDNPLNKIRESIKRIPFKFKDQSVQITISIGASAFKEGDTPHKVFDRADSALYEAKNTGRDQVITTP